MPVANTVPFLAAAALLSACGGGGNHYPAPAPRSVVPSAGFTGQAVAVRILGDGFLAKPDGSGVDRQQRAWLDDTELTDVTWIDAQTLTATVPPTIPPGLKTLRVENAYGLTGSLASAFTAEEVPAGLAAAIAAAPAADVGQPVAVSLTVTNGGTGAAQVTAVVPSSSGAAASCGTPSPPTPVPLAASASQVFGWSCAGSAAGTLVLSGSVSGTDTTTGRSLTATAVAPAQVAVQVPAALSAAVSVDGGPSAVTVGEAYTLRLSASNPGGAAATLSALSVTPISAGCGAPSPSLPQTVAGGTAVAVTFPCAAIEPGNLAPAVSLSGQDSNTGDLLTASATVDPAVEVQAPAAIAAAVGADLTVLKVGQEAAVTFTVTNGASSPAATVTSLASWSTGSGSATCTTPSFTPGISIPAGATRSFAWTCTALAPGDLLLGGTLNFSVSSGPGSVSPAVPLAVTVTP
ncbi:MAG TPA: hypothetical protein VMU15_15275 [Anaeromyxobacter sp.]|nr:hypothetical protein [Anaeromyxobacter sp.]